MASLDELRAKMDERTAKKLLPPVFLECIQCSQELAEDKDEVDIGVGVQSFTRGYTCPACGWGVGLCEGCSIPLYPGETHATYCRLTPGEEVPPPEDKALAPFDPEPQRCLYTTSDERTCTLLGGHSSDHAFDGRTCNCGHTRGAHYVPTSEAVKSIERERCKGLIDNSGDQWCTCGHVKSEHESRGDGLCDSASCGCISYQPGKSRRCLCTQSQEEVLRQITRVTQQAKAVKKVAQTEIEARDRLAAKEREGHEHPCGRCGHGVKHHNKPEEPKQEKCDDCDFLKEHSGSALCSFHLRRRKELMKGARPTTACAFKPETPITISGGPRGGALDLDGLCPCDKYDGTSLRETATGWDGTTAPACTDCGHAESGHLLGKCATCDATGRSGAKHAFTLEPGGSSDSTCNHRGGHKKWHAELIAKGRDKTCAVCGLDEKGRAFGHASDHAFTPHTLSEADKARLSKPVVSEDEVVKAWAAEAPPGQVPTLYGVPFDDYVGDLCKGCGHARGKHIELDSTGASAPFKFRVKHKSCDMMLPHVTSGGESVAIKCHCLEFKE